MVSIDGKYINDLYFHIKWSNFGKWFNFDSKYLTNYFNIWKKGAIKYSTQIYQTVFGYLIIQKCEK